MVGAAEVVVGAGDAVVGEELVAAGVAPEQPAAMARESPAQIESPSAVAR